MTILGNNASVETKKTISNHKPQMSMAVVMSFMTFCHSFGIKKKYI